MKCRFYALKCSSHRGYLKFEIPQNKDREGIMPPPHPEAPEGIGNLDSKWSFLAPKVCMIT